MSAPRGKIVQFSLIALLCLLEIMLFLKIRSSPQKQSTPSITHTTVPVVRYSTSPRIEPEKGWCRYYSDDSVFPAQVLSKELFIRGVFFDRRVRGGYSNSTVFLVEANRLTLASKDFAGCRVGPYVSNKFLFRPAVSYRFVQNKKGSTSSLALIDCYDIPAVNNGDPASLYYRSPTGWRAKIQSLKPLFVPEPRAAVTRSTLTSIVCLGMVRTGAQSPSERGMLYHWLRYQKVIGVDHVHMAVEDSFVRDGGLQNEVIQQAVREGYLSIGFWPFWLNPTEVYNSQKLAYQDCLYRFQGVYDYIIYADSDDFFVPVKESKTIEDYLQKWCSDETATCQFKWIQFFPDCGWDPKLIGADGNFTNSVMYKPTMERSVTKSAHQMKVLVDAGTHLANILLDGYVQAEVPVNEAYFAHMRFGWPPVDGC